MARQIVLILCLTQWSGAAPAGGRVLFRDGINHPDDRGHRIFIAELMKFF